MHFGALDKDFLMPPFLLKSDDFLPLKWPKNFYEAFFKDLGYKTVGDANYFNEFFTQPGGHYLIYGK